MGTRATSQHMLRPSPTIIAYQLVHSTQEIAVAVRHILATDIQQLALVAISLRFEQVDSHEASQQTKACLTSLVEALRPLVRKSDHVFCLHHTLYFVLLDANLQGGQTVQARLWEGALWHLHNTADQTFTHPRSMSIGYSACSGLQPNFMIWITQANEANLTIDWQPDVYTRTKSASAIPTASPISVEQAPEEDEAALSALARAIGVPYLSTLPRQLPATVQHVVNPTLAQELHCCPIGRERNMLTVAIADPASRATLDRLQRETGLTIFPVLTPPHELQSALKQLD